MSIEKNIKRIADALETIASNLTGLPVDPPRVKVGEVKHVPQAPAPAAPAPQAPAAPAAPAAPQATMTPEELNEALVGEFRRLGNRESIDKAMADLGVTSVTQLTPAQYQPLLDTVRSY